MPRLVFGLILGAILVALSGCGVATSSGNSTESSGVALPSEDRRDSGITRTMLHAYYDELIETGVKPSVAHCYVMHVRKLSSAQQDRLLDSTNSNDVVIRINRLLSEACVKGNPLSSDVTGEQLDETRDRMKEAVDPIIEEQGANDSQVACVDEAIDGFSDRQLKQMAANNEHGVQVAREAVQSCGAER